MKKLITFILAMTVLAGSALAYPGLKPDSGAKYTDRQGVERQLHAISGYGLQQGYYLPTAELINGYPDGSFRPDNNITYGEVCQVLSNVYTEKRKASVVRASSKWCPWVNDTWAGPALVVASGGNKHPLPFDAWTFTNEKAWVATSGGTPNINYLMKRRDISLMLGMMHTGTAHATVDYTTWSAPEFTDYSVSTNLYNNELNKDNNGIYEQRGGMIHTITAWQNAGIAGIKQATTWNSFVATNELKHAGVISGYPDGTFRPEEHVTRAEFITMVCRFFRDTELQFTPTENIPADCVGHWAEEYISKCYADGGVA